MFFGDYLASTVGPFWTHIIKNMFILASGAIIGIISFMFILAAQFKHHTRKEQLKDEDGQNILFFAFREKGRFHSFSCPSRSQDWIYILPLHFYYRYVRPLFPYRRAAVTLRWEDLRTSKIVTVAFAVTVVFLAVYGVYLCFHITDYFHGMTFADLKDIDF